MSLFLGVDTSAYTTSIALVDEKLNLIADERLVLQVKLGQRGLRQSEALFRHVKNLPLLFKRLEPHFALQKPVGIAVSAFPRNIPGSYMPVFLAGLSHSQAISAVTGIPLYSVSHQEGHIMAGVAGNHELLNRSSFLAVHFSGGTSELLRVTAGEKSIYNISLTQAGSDLHAGQLVDRVGVAMGLPFPSGRSMEKIALEASDDDIPLIPSAVSADGFSFSGAETRARALIEAGCPHGKVARAVFRTIANTLEKSLLAEFKQSGIKEALLVGGVMANQLIRRRLISRLEHPAVGMKLYFADPHLSTDNAVGVALLGVLLQQRDFNSGGCLR
jgi:N6-L-threonylcarbamoyladenine synthase